MHSGGRRPSRLATAAASSLITLLALTVILPAVGIPAAAAPSIRINIPGESPVPILQRGAWHDVVVTLDTPPAVDVALLASSDTAAPPQDNTNSYEWRYEVGGGFSDVLYGTYLDPGNSTAASPTEIRFRIGVEITAITGPWTMRLVVDGALPTVFSLSVTDPQVGFGVSTADFVLLVEPYTAMVANSSESGQDFRVINSGTLPMALSIAFDRDEERFEVSNWTGELPSGPGTQRRHNLTFQSDAWAPQRFEANATISATALYVIPSPNATQLVRIFQGKVPITIQVGHSGFTLSSFSGVSFEHQETVQSSPNSILRLPAYLSGNATVDVSVEFIGLTLEGAEVNGTAASLPATLVLTNISQTELALTLHTGAEGVNGTLTYRVSIPATGEERTFESAIIVVSEPPPEDEGGGGGLSPITVFLGAVLGVAGAFIAYNQIGAMRRRAKEREALLAQRRRRKGEEHLKPSRTQLKRRR